MKTTNEFDYNCMCIILLFYIIEHKMTVLNNGNPNKDDLIKLTKALHNFELFL